MATDFEAEGLLEGVEGEEPRKARLELLRKLEDDGTPLEELRAAVEENRLVLLPVDRVLSGEGKRYTREELAEEVGLDLDLLLRVWRALGQAEVPSGEPSFTDEDLRAAEAVKRFLDAGIPEDRLLELSRSMSRATMGVARAVGEAFAEAFLQPGVNEAELAFRYADGTRALVPLLDEVTRHMLHLHLRERARNAVIGDAELESGRLVGSETIAVCFADLVGFTKLGERLPSEELGSVAGRLAELAAEAAEPPVRMVKTIGDAAMLVSDEPGPLVEAALSLVESAERQGQAFPSVHAGIAHGEALPRGGDWYGRPVNLASRITDFARAGSVVADATVREAADGHYDWSRIGRRRLKGIRGQVELFRVRRPGSGEG
ncbi:MAG TPA: adenylate cyclase regulatory domain-containing protein [Thermoleophilaceae bacterium]|nr:adenylate cyclase regulatory domain-containing protein [Thermoleophilaceae bacterium]